MKTVMRALLPSLLILALPIIGAPQGSSKPDGDAVSKRFSEEGIQAAPEFLDISYIFDNNPIHASAIPELSSSDFGEVAKRSEKMSLDRVHLLLESAAAYFKLDKFTDIESTMNHIVNAAATLRDDISSALDAHNITFDAFSQELEGIFMEIMNDLEKIPSPDKAPGHADRVKSIDKILDNITRELQKFVTPFGIEERFTTFLTALKPHVEVLIVTVGDINQQYPQLLPVLLSIVATLLIPEQWILKPILRLFGFGSKGPMKGSVAAWMQSNFWGAAVKADSWFSWFQAAGMGTAPK